MRRDIKATVDSAQWAADIFSWLPTCRHGKQANFSILPALSTLQTTMMSNNACSFSAPSQEKDSLPADDCVLLAVKEWHLADLKAEGRA